MSGITSAAEIRRAYASKCSASFVTLFAALTAACGGSPTAAPSPVPTSLVFVGCGEVVNGYQCSAKFAESEAGPSRDVTGLATWSTSDPSVATVNSVGFVTALQNGDVAIRTSYRGTEGFTTLSVRPGGQNYYFRALSGWIIDSRNETKIGGVTVRILDGPNANRSVTGGPEGAYQIYELEPGTFTVQFSKTGYITSTLGVTLPGDRFVSLDARLTPSGR